MAVSNIEGIVIFTWAKDLFKKSETKSIKTRETTAVVFFCNVLITVIFNEMQLFFIKPSF